MDAITQVIQSAMRARDPYTVSHQERVTHIASAIAGEMHLPGERLEALRMAGTLHDLGKISVPAEILSKPGRLSAVEFAVIQTHPWVGFDILKPLETHFPAATNHIILQHHERLDGSGYPQGLKGNDIMLEARILCVADVIEAMASHRPYRPSLGIDRALEEINQHRGVLYDASVVDACANLYAKDCSVFTYHYN